MNKLFIGNTDHAWFDFLAQQVELEEVNFWQPGGNTRFRAIAPGELFLFRLRRPLPQNLEWHADTVFKA